MICLECGADLSKPYSVLRPYTPKSEDEDYVWAEGHYTADYESDGLRRSSFEFVAEHSVSLPHHDLIEEDRCARCDTEVWPNCSDILSVVLETKGILDTSRIVEVKGRLISNQGLFMKRNRRLREFLSDPSNLPPVLGINEYLDRIVGNILKGTVKIERPEKNGGEI